MTNATARAELLSLLLLLWALTVLFAQPRQATDAAARAELCYTLVWPQARQPDRLCRPCIGYSVHLDILALSLLWSRNSWITRMTDWLTDHCNPRCTCTPRVNKGEVENMTVTPCTSQVTTQWHCLKCLSLEILNDTLSMVIWLVICM